MTGLGKRSDQGPAPSAVRVIVGDDHPVFRDGVIRLLQSSDDIQLAGEANNGEEAMLLIRLHRPDVALLDYRMPKIDGIGVAQMVRKEGLATRILILSAHDESELVFRALESGACGYLPKDSSRNAIIYAILDCARGRNVIAPRLVSDLSVEERRRQTKQEQDILSPRERQVLEMMAEGRSIPAIAVELRLAPSTIKTHTKRLYDKLSVGDRAAAVAEAMRRGLLK